MTAWQDLLQYLMDLQREQVRVPGSSHTLRKKPCKNVLFFFIFSGTFNNFLFGKIYPNSILLKINKI